MQETDNLLAFLKTRRSIRRFLPDAIPAATLREILRVAAFAPSAHHRQPWRFAALTKRTSIARFAEKMTDEFRKTLEADGTPPAAIEKQTRRSLERIGGAPALIVACADLSEMRRYPDERRQRAEHLLAVQSVANAGMQLLLAAHAQGLGGVWLGSPIFAQRAVSEILNLPPRWEPQAMFLIGKAADVPQARARKPLEEISIFIDEEGGSI